MREATCGLGAFVWRRKAMEEESQEEVGAGEKQHVGEARVCVARNYRV